MAPDGILSATYSNGTTKKLYQIALANFNATSQLKALGNSNFGVSAQSGDAMYLDASKGAGKILSGTLEESNTDVTVEILTTIQAQQRFNGNARMLQTLGEVLSRLTDKI